MISSEFEEISNKIAKEKEIIDHALKGILDSVKLDCSNVNELHQRACEFFSNFEKFLVKCSDSGLTNVQLVDVSASVENILEFSISYWEVIRLLSKINNLPIEPSTKFLATAQAVLKCSNKKSAKLFKAKFQENMLPIEGFMSKPLNLRERSVDWSIVIFGFIVLLLSSVFAYYLEMKDGVQYLVVRIFLSLGVGLIFTGFVKLNVIKMKYDIGRFKLTAGGAVVVFLLVYFVNPPDAPQIRRNDVDSSNNSGTN